MSFKPCTSAFSPVRTHKEFAFIRESLEQSQSSFQNVQSHDSGRADVRLEVWLGSPERLFPGFTDVAQEATFGAGRACVGCERKVDVVRPAHLGGGDCGKTSDQRHDPRRHHCGIGSCATNSYALGRYGRSRYSCRLGYLRRGLHGTFTCKEAAQAAGEAWKHIVHDHNGQSIVGPTN